MQISLQQQAGLGDVLFLIKGAYAITEAGHDVHWSIGNKWGWLAEKDTNKNIHYYSETDLEHRDFCDFNINLQYGAGTCADDQMTSKYQMIKRLCNEHGIPMELDHYNWQDYVRGLKRNKLKEESLFNKKCAELDKYVLINNTWSSGAIDKHIYNKFNLDCPIVWFEKVEGDTLLDWAKIYENASGVISVNTACDLMFDAFDSKAEFYYVHMRDGYCSYQALKDVYTRKPWQWMNVLA